MKEFLCRLKSLKPEEEDYSRTIELVMASLHPHNDDEEIKDIPLLEAAIGSDASREAAQSFKTTKKLVPTRYVPPFLLVSPPEPCGEIDDVWITSERTEPASF